MKTRILVAEDSKTVRALIVEILSRESDLEVVGEAEDGIEAIEMAKRLRPDVIAMDIEMPRLDGYRATLEIMRDAPTPVVMVTGLDLNDVERAIRALETGAVAAVAKPVNPQSPDFHSRRRDLVDTLRAMASVKVVRHHARHATRAKLPVRVPRDPVEIVAIAASTGGPIALRDVFAKLDRDSIPPIMVVQHVSPGFVEGLARWLSQVTQIEACVARQGDLLVRGRVYLAPDHRHLGLLDSGDRIALLDSPPVGMFRPSATILFEEVARVFGSKALAIMLTGMGDDGLAGLRAVRKSGGEIVAQDEQSALIYGMPGSVVLEGLADAVLSPEGIVEIIGARGRPRGES